MDMRITIDDTLNTPLTAFAAASFGGDTAAAASQILTNFLSEYRQSLQQQEAATLAGLDPADVTLLQAIFEAPTEKQAEVRQAVKAALGLK